MSFAIKSIVLRVAYLAISIENDCLLITLNFPNHKSFRLAKFWPRILLCSQEKILSPVLISRKYRIKAGGAHKMSSNGRIESFI
jgi:hypothetical protein